MKKIFPEVGTDVCLSVRELRWMASAGTFLILPSSIAGCSPPRQHHLSASIDEARGYAAELGAKRAITNNEPALVVRLMASPRVLGVSQTHFFSKKKGAMRNMSRLSWQSRPMLNEPNGSRQFL
jgi:hypothetical protein